ncbi:MAG TPA: hypothetical protein PLC12_01380 [Candidatus Methanofastidiosa archaeon]|nr:hypothetical protein [Candidatus Methanofastidiosa archaeon]
MNIRSATLEGYIDAATVIAEMDGLVEIDAHCRQPEITEIGAGQALLSDIPRLTEILRSIKDACDARTIVKIRGNIVPERELAISVNDFCDALHVDAMIEGSAETDLSVFLNIPDWIFLIGNNSVRDADSALAILEFCDAFSFARLASDLDKVRSMMEELG